MSKLNNKVVLITGGAGNIGSYILDKVLEQKPDKCIVVDNLFNSDKSYKKLSDNLVKFYPLDISKLDEMEYIFETYKPEYVFHCASMLIQDSEILPRKSINTNMKSIIDKQFQIDFNVPLKLDMKIGNNWLDTNDIM